MSPSPSLCHPSRSAEAAHSADLATLSSEEKELAKDELTKAPSATSSSTSADCGSPPGPAESSPEQEHPDQSSEEESREELAPRKAKTAAKTASPSSQEPSTSSPAPSRSSPSGEEAKKEAKAPSPVSGAPADPAKSSPAPSPPSGASPSEEDDATRRQDVVNMLFHLVEAAQDPRASTCEANRARIQAIDLIAALLPAATLDRLLSLSEVPKAKPKAEPKLKPKAKPQSAGGQADPHDEDEKLAGVIVRFRKEIQRSYPSVRLDAATLRLWAARGSPPPEVRVPEVLGAEAWEGAEGECGDGACESARGQKAAKARLQAKLAKRKAAPTTSSSPATASATSTASEAKEWSETGPSHSLLSQSIKEQKRIISRLKKAIAKDSKATVNEANVARVDFIVKMTTGRPSAKLDKLLKTSKVPEGCLELIELEDMNLEEVIARREESEDQVVIAMRLELQKSYPKVKLDAATLQAWAVEGLPPLPKAAKPRTSLPSHKEPEAPPKPTATEAPPMPAKASPEPVKAPPSPMEPEALPKPAQALPKTIEAPPKLKEPEAPPKTTKAPPKPAKAPPKPKEPVPALEVHSKPSEAPLKPQEPVTKASPEPLSEDSAAWETVAKRGKAKRTPPSKRPALKVSSSSSSTASDSSLSSLRSESCQPPSPAPSWSSATPSAASSTSRSSQEPSRASPTPSAEFGGSPTPSTASKTSSGSAGPSKALSAVSESSPEALRPTTSTPSTFSRSSAELLKTSPAPSTKSGGSRTSPEPRLSLLEHLGYEDDLGEPSGYGPALVQLSRLARLVRGQRARLCDELLR